MTDASSGHVGTRGLLCKQCGYALRGLPEDSVCPECGLAIVASRGDADFAHSPAEFLSRVRRGLACVRVGAIGLAVSALLGVAAALAESTGVVRRPGVTVVGLLALMSMAVCFGGWCLASARDPANLYDKVTDEARRAARTWSAVALAFAALRALDLFGVLPAFRSLGGTPTVPFESVWSVLLVGLMCGACVVWIAPVAQLIASLRFARYLGIRSRTAEVPGHVRRVWAGVGLVLFALVVTVALLEAAGIDVGWIMLIAAAVASVLYARLPGPIDRDLAAAQDRQAARHQRGSAL